MRHTIVYRNCPRCGKQTAGLNKPIHGSQECFEKYAGICEDCMTKEEHENIMYDQLSNGFFKLVGENLRPKIEKT